MGSTAQDVKKLNGSGKKRGSVDNAGRLTALKRAEKEQQGSASWESADPRWLSAVVIHCTLTGMEVSFCLAKSGSAHGLKLYDFRTGERAALWFNQDADLNAELEKVYYELGGL